MEPHNDLLKQEIFRRMKDKETEELLEIWKKNDRGEWSDDAFAAIHDILLERLGKVPEQGEKTEPRNDSPASEYYLRGPYHSQKKLLGIASWSNVLSWILLSIGAIIAIIRIINLKSSQDTVLRYDDSLYSLMPYLTQLSSFLLDLFLFFVLQGLSQCIYILIDISEGKRKI